MKAFALRLFLPIVLLAFAAAALAQNYPARPVRMVTPFPPAGSLDVVGRAIVSRLGASLGQPVVLENRPGAGGIIGTEAVAKSPPDGYTLLLSSASTHSIAPALNPKLPYDPVKDFSPIVMVTPGGASVLMVSTASTWKSAGELVAYIKAHPGEVSFGSGGIGTVPHLNTEALAAFAGLKMIHVPYKGAALAMPDLVSGRLTFMFDSVVSAQSHVLAGKVRALGVSGGKRTPILPEVPTLPESGLPGFDPAGAYMGLWAPAGTPPPIVQRLNAEMNRLLASTELREQMAKLGIEPSGGTPEAFGAQVQRDIGRWAEVVRATGLKVE